MKLYEKATGKPVTFDTPDAAQAAFMTGKYGVKSSDVVPMRGPDGAIHDVPATAVKQGFAAGGAFVAPEEVRAFDLEQKHGGVVGTAKAAAAGLARGLTLGLSDVALGGIGGKETRQTLSELKEAHPIASTGGELVGAVAPAFVGDEAGLGTAGAKLAALGEAGEAARGASLAAKGVEAGRGALSLASAPARGMAAVGDLAEHAAKGIFSVTPESGLGSRVVAKALQMGARGAGEGAVIGAGSEISEDALGDHELTAERLLSAVGHGALYGLAGGAATGAAGEVAGSALRKIGGKASPTLERMADEQAWKSLSPLKKFSEEAEARAGGTAAVGRTLREEGVVAFGDNIESLAPKITRAKDAVGEKLGAIVDQSGGRVHMDDVMGAFEHVIDPLRKKALHEGIVTSLEEAKESLFGQLEIRADGTVSVQNLVAQRKALDAMAYQEAKALDPKLRVAFLRDIRSGLDKVETKAIDDAAATISPSARGEYKALKTKYQHLSIAEKAAETTTSRMATNRNFSLTDYIAGVGGVASGHPGLVAAAGVNKLLRERGNASAAAVLGKLADMTAIQRTAATAERRMSDAVDELLSGKPATKKLRAPRLLKTDRGEDTEAEYKRRVSEIQDRATEPYRAAAAILPVMNHAPKTAGALAEAAARTTAFLAQKIPQNHVDDGTLTPLASRRTGATMQQMRDFNRLARVADDPLSVLDAAKRGTLTADQVQTLKIVAPKTYQELSARVQEELAEKSKSLDPHQETQLRLLLGLRTGNLDPRRVQAFQGAFAPPAPPKTPSQAEPKGKHGGSPPLHAATVLRTASQQATLGTK